MKRIVTYDVKHDYLDFYDFVEEYGGKQLTESTYEFDTKLTEKEFAEKLKKVFSRGDIVYYISVDSNNKLFYKQIEF